jgi:hypothetical protein
VHFDSNSKEIEYMSQPFPGPTRASAPSSSRGVGAVDDILSSAAASELTRYDWCLSVSATPETATDAFGIFSCGVGT